MESPDWPPAVSCTGISKWILRPQHGKDGLLGHHALSTRLLSRPDGWVEGRLGAGIGPCQLVKYRYANSAACFISRAEIMML